MIEPMSSSAGSDDSLELVGLDPDDFFDSAVSPELEALSAELHRSAGDPEVDESFFLQQVDAETLHFFVLERAVGQLRLITIYVHVDVPRGVEHDGRAVAEHGEIEFSEVAVDPLFRSVLHLVGEPLEQPRSFFFFVVDLVVDVLAVLHVPARVQVRAVAQVLVRVRVYQPLEVHVCARAEDALLPLPFHAVVFRPELAELLVLVRLHFELDYEIIRLR